MFEKIGNMFHKNNEIPKEEPRYRLNDLYWYCIPDKGELTLIVRQQQGDQEYYVDYITGQPFDTENFIGEAKPMFNQEDVVRQPVFERGKFKGYTYSNNLAKINHMRVTHGKHETSIKTDKYYQRYERFGRLYNRFLIESANPNCEIVKSYDAWGGSAIRYSFKDPEGNLDPQLLIPKSVLEDCLKDMRKQALTQHRLISQPFTIEAHEKWKKEMEASEAALFR